MRFGVMYRYHINFLIAYTILSVFRCLSHLCFLS